MSVKKTIETKDKIIFSTETYEFKIDEDKLDKFKDENYEGLATKIQKSMKMLNDYSSGVIWQEAFEEIYTEITGRVFESPM